MAAIVPDRRTVSTTMYEKSRATRLTSVTTRACSSPECREMKKETGMPWMWA